MSSWANPSGAPLADSSWLEVHHLAKLPERLAFAEKLAKLRPQTVVDLGCATGLWLELLHKTMPAETKFIGIDADAASIAQAAERAKDWGRQVEFRQLDLNTQADQIPAADLTIAFNTFNYIKDLPGLINTLASRTPRGTLVVRQYDGASIRFGPMNTAERQQMETALFQALAENDSFDHYDLDRTFAALENSDYTDKKLHFELFERTRPFSPGLDAYYRNKMEYFHGEMNGPAAEQFRNWIDKNSTDPNGYFYEVDLIGWLS